jgi:hypothetical protein
MFTSFVALIAAAVTASSESSAALSQPDRTAAPPAVAAQAAPVDKGREVVCRRMQATGSRMGAEKVCKTRAEWARINQDAEDLVNSAQTNALHYSPGGG